MSARQEEWTLLALDLEEEASKANEWRGAPLSCHPAFAPSPSGRSFEGVAAPQNITVGATESHRGRPNLAVNFAPLCSAKAAVLQTAPSQLPPNESVPRSPPSPTAALQTAPPKLPPPSESVPKPPPSPRIVPSKPFPRFADPEEDESPGGHQGGGHAHGLRAQRVGAGVVVSIGSEGFDRHRSVEQKAPHRAGLEVVGRQSRARARRTSF